MDHFEFVAMWTPGTFEWLIIAGIALLLFGKRLPDVARSLGKGVVEFKKGLKGIEDDVDSAEQRRSSSPSSSSPSYTDSQATPSAKDPPGTA